MSEEGRERGISREITPFRGATSHVSTGKRLRAKAAAGKKSYSRFPFSRILEPEISQVRKRRPAQPLEDKSLGFSSFLGASLASQKVMSSMLKIFRIKTLRGVSA